MSSARSSRQARRSTVFYLGILLASQAVFTRAAGGNRLRSGVAGQGVGAEPEHADRSLQDFYDDNYHDDDNGDYSALVFLVMFLYWAYCCPAPPPSHQTEETRSAGSGYGSTAVVPPAAVGWDAAAADRAVSAVPPPASPQCLICQRAPATYAFSPCGHRAVCGSCKGPYSDGSAQLCPACRQTFHVCYRFPPPAVASPATAAARPGDFSDALASWQSYAPHAATPRHARDRAMSSRAEALASCATPRASGHQDVVARASAGARPSESDDVALPPTNSRVCCICMDAPATHAFVPCGHLCLCGACTEPYTKSDTNGYGKDVECPQCRKAFYSVMKVY